MASTGRYGSPVGHRRLVFAESNAKVNVEIRQRQLQLEKEISRLERQAKTATTNIANYQQSLKNTYRKLEQRRKEAQAQDRERKLSDGVGPSRKGLMFSTSIKLGLESEDAYDLESSSNSSLVETHARHGGSSETASDAEPVNGPQKSRSTSVRTRNSSETSAHQARQIVQSDAAANNSPCLSSPASVRKTQSSQGSLTPRTRSGSVQNPERVEVSPLVRSRHSSFKTSVHPRAKQQGAEFQLSVPTASTIPAARSVVELETKVQQVPLGSKSVDHMLRTSPSPKAKSNSGVKLPPLAASKSVVSMSPSSLNKKTLLEAAQAMNFKAGSKSHGPKAFGKFYDPHLAPSIVITPSAREKTTTSTIGKATMNDQDIDPLTLDQLTDEEREGVADKEQLDDLAVLFEEIRNCRYIRHYRPHGCPDDEET